MSYQDVYWSNSSHQVCLERYEKKLSHYTYGSDEYKLYATLSDYHLKVINLQRRKKRLLTKDERIKVFKKLKKENKL